MLTRKPICQSTQEIVNIEMFIGLSLIISFSKILFHISDVEPDRGAIFLRNTSYRKGLILFPFWE
jgi:hypothetical protein